MATKTTSVKDAKKVETTDDTVLVTDIDPNQVMEEGFGPGQRDGTSVDQGPVPRLDKKVAASLQEERDLEKSEADLRYGYKIEQRAAELAAEKDAPAPEKDA